ncbi:MAG TPA: TlyA family RNA methyltransferase [Myxococcota bacterium]|nr:TlyA family RNA methyltransferase [Myxococcota bacterium]HRY94330.1 TlyA family RNA methyltransferase [Myxococcota bacterium]
MAPRGEEKIRLDQLLVERGLASSRTLARALVLAGQVVVGENRVDKPGTRVPAGSPVRIKGPAHPFASRGGLKLEAALEAFGLDPAGRTGLDVGASTGGFTDCLLQRGAARVIALDVGWGQLLPRLRGDPRVVVMERFNARFLAPGHLPAVPEFAVFDLSFISLRLVLPPVLACLAPGAWLVLLVKPQFEVGRERVGKGGIVRDEAARQEALEQVAACARALGLVELGRVPSPITGADGNVEFLLGLRAP